MSKAVTQVLFAVVVTGSLALGCSAAPSEGDPANDQTSEAVSNYPAVQFEFCLFGGALTSDNITSLLVEGDNQHGTYSVFNHSQAWGQKCFKTTNWWWENGTTVSVGIGLNGGTDSNVNFHIAIPQHCVTNTYTYQWNGLGTWWGAC
jgi:hypothetical protein